MDVFNRHSQHSKIIVCKDIELIDNPVKQDNGEIISIGFCEFGVVVEYVKGERWGDYIAEKQASVRDNASKEEKPAMPADVRKALATKLNSDPFKMGVAGLTLEEIYKKYPEWVEKARNELLNEFILAKMEIIDAYIANSKGC